jgi:hypothetical protein
MNTEIISISIPNSIFGTHAPLILIGIAETYTINGTSAVLGYDEENRFFQFTPEIFPAAILHFERLYGIDVREYIVNP